jgi:CPA2 family monovalent cation:H+ antiporter-2
MDSLFLGGILSISSTTIIVRAFEELGMKGKNFVTLVFGALIVEDLIAILLMVLLTSVAVSQTLSGSALFQSSLRLGFFLVLWFLLGIYILPIVLRRLRDYLSDETILIVSIGLCLTMVVVANSVGFSPALGAFVMGSILAETREGHRIEHLMLPVKDLFSAVFFVSVGMLIDPTVLNEYFWVILLITVVTIVGKFLSTAVGALISGRSLRTSVQAGMSLAQIGEFSFIIATLGLTLKVTSPFLYPIAVAVSAVTTFTTPYLIKYSGPFHTWIERRLPDNLKASLARYESAMSTTSEKGAFSLLWDEYGMKIVFNSVITIGITLAMSRLVEPQVAAMGLITNPAVLDLVMCSVALTLASPFLWAVFVGGPAHANLYRGEIINQLRRLQLGLYFVRFMIGCALAAFLVSNFTSILAFSGLLFVVLAAVGAFFFSRYSEPIYNSIETKFIENLTENERAELEKRTKIPELAPWNATLVDFELSPDSTLVAKSLQESLLKERFGVTIAMIERGSRKILAPVRTDLLLPYDRIYLIGTDEQLTAAKAVIEVDAVPVDGNSSHYGLMALTVASTDVFVNKPIRECGLREAVNGLIVGLERNGQRMLSPDSGMMLLENDLIWLVGDKALIQALRS